MERKLITVKVGTSSLTGPDGSICPEKIEYIATQIAALREAGHTVILVTSGAVAAGFRRIGYAKRPTSIPAKQAAAAVGQGLLLEEYTRFFEAKGIVSAQILLTRDDFRDRRRYKNAFNALEIILQRGAVPIINENDTVSVEEIVFGDNDRLSAMVAAVCGADILIILTDIMGLYDSDPRGNKDAKLISRVDNITDEIFEISGGAGTNRGTGGMKTKIEAAEYATSRGIDTIVMCGKEPSEIYKVFEGKKVGTLFKAKH